MIDGVVVHEGREMDEFDDGCQRQRVGMVSIGHAARQEQQRRTEELAPHEEQVLVDFLDVIEVRDDDATNLVADAFEWAAYRLLNGRKLGRNAPHRLRHDVPEGPDFGAECMNRVYRSSLSRSVTSAKLISSENTRS